MSWVLNISAEQCLGPARAPFTHRGIVALRYQRQENEYKAVCMGRGSTEESLGNCLVLLLTEAHRGAGLLELLAVPEGREGGGGGARRHYT